MYMNIKPDPDFGRLRKTLLLEGKADRVPLFDFNIHPSIMEKTIHRPLRTAEDEIDFWLGSGYDYIQIRLKPSAYAAAASKSVSSSHGSLKCMEQLMNEAFEWTSIYKNEWSMDDYNLAYLNALSSKLPNSMRFIAHVADIYTRSWITMGFEDFCYALYEDPELIAELFRQNAMAEIRMLDVLVNNFGDKIGALFYSDDLAYTEGLMVSAEVYRQYLWPYLRELFSVAKRLDIPIIYHTDGKLWDVFDDFYELGVNGIQPLEPKSMDLAELKQKRGRQFCLMGSIDIDVLSRGTEIEIDHMVRERIGMLGYDGGYTVGTSNTVPDYTNINNYKAMIKAAFKYGKY